MLVWGLGGDHNDFLMMFFIVLAFWLLLRARESERLAAAEAGAARMARPASPALIGAGAALVVAAGLKASAAVLIPVVLAGLLGYRRALAQVLVGMVLGGIVGGRAQPARLRPAHPRPQYPEPARHERERADLIGLAVGGGGETETLHKVMTAALIVSVLACCWYAWSPRRRPDQEGRRDRRAHDHRVGGRVSRCS